MENINLHNYEAFLLDHLEGNLSSAHLKELHAFIARHPELEIDLTDLSMPVLEENTIHAGFKEDLKRHSSYVSEDRIIDYVEGNLSQKEKIEFEAQIVSNTHLAKEVKLFKACTLISDKNILFSGKSNLFKTEEAYVLNHAALAYLENDLSPIERLDFEKQLKSQENLRKEFDLLEKTVHVPDRKLVYQNKQELKKHTKVFFLFRAPAMASMAAAILLLFGMYMIFSTLYQTDPVNLNLSEAASQKKNNTKDLSGQNQPSIAALAPIESQLKTAALEYKIQSASKGQIHLQNTEKTTEIKDSLLIERVLQSQSAQSDLAENKETESVLSKELTEENKAAIASAIHSELVKLKTLPEAVDEEEEFVAEVPSKNRLWKKAVKIAQRVNDLGLRSINGTECSKDQYLLSFNSFSIEKK